MTQQRKNAILGEIIFWAMEVINDDEEFYDVARNSWGLTEKECEELDIEKPEDKDDEEE